MRNSHIESHTPETKPIPKATRGFEHINRYYDKRMKLYSAKILPGECYVSAQGEMIVTVLGSCVSACIRDRVIGVGGMNHFMLPVQSSEKAIERTNMVNSALCYGNWAMEFLINEVIKLGGRKEQMEVKIFGGGRVLSGTSNIDVGGRNISFITDFLHKENLPIVSKDVGSDCPRKVLYFPDTGAVKMKRLLTRANETVEIREKEYLDSMTKTSRPSDVELF